jgi:hypothetical protein
MMLLSVAATLVLLSFHASAWPAEKPSSGNAAVAGAKILELMAQSASGKRAENSQLDTLYKDLDPILFPDVFGTYAGGLFCGNCKSDINWAGKQFVNATYANPLLVYPSTTDKSVIIKHPRDNIAKMEERTAFGKKQAAVVYRKNGVVDFLRIVVNGTELGLVLIGKATLGGTTPTTPAYFTLTKDLSMEAKVQAGAGLKSP